MGQNFLTQDEVKFIGDKAIDIIEKSLERIKNLEEMKKEEVEDEDDQLDEEDLALIKEEGSQEYDLQLAAAELMGTLFKTHSNMVAELVYTLRTQTLDQAFKSGV